MINAETQEKISYNFERKMEMEEFKILAIIHPHDYHLTECSDRFHSLCDGYLIVKKVFLTMSNVKVELQTQIFGENVFQPLLVKKYRMKISGQDFVLS
ncbi:hypothetical protein P8452_46383 [Trifolium repens]|nr:hypothetical protein P8452_46383 [Trifolium repens]